MLLIHQILSYDYEKRTLSDSEQFITCSRKSIIGMLSCGKFYKLRAMVDESVKFLIDFLCYLKL